MIPVWSHANQIATSLNRMKNDPFTNSSEMPSHLMFYRPSLTRSNQGLDSKT